jgi:hypothetical protein
MQVLLRYLLSVILPPFPTPLPKSSGVKGWFYKKQTQP